MSKMITVLQKQSNFVDKLVVKRVLQDWRRLIGIEMHELIQEELQAVRTMQTTLLVNI